MKTAMPSAERTEEAADTSAQAGTEASPEPKAAPAPQMSSAMKRSNLIFALALPIFFAVMFPLCYISALHQPTPHDLPVAVAGPAATQFVDQVQPSLAGTVAATPV